MATRVGQGVEEGDERRDEMARLLTDAHEQLVERDAELRHLKEVLVTLEGDYRALAANFEQVQHTRAWRAVVRYRRLRARLGA